MSRLVVLAIMLLAQFTNGVPAAKRIEKAGMIEGHKMKEGPNESNGPSAKVALLTKNVTKQSSSAKEAADAADHEVAKFTSGTLASCAEVKMEGFCSHEKAKTHCPVSCKTAKADTHIVQSTSKVSQTIP